MWNNLLGAPGTAGLITGLAYLGAVTALAITGHITGADALVALGILGGGATAVTATHVAGNAITKAAGATVTAGAAPDPPPAPPAVTPTPAAPAQTPPAPLV
jgi:hypothetical protein